MKLIFFISYLAVPHPCNEVGSLSCNVRLGLMQYLNRVTKVKKTLRFEKPGIQVSTKITQDYNTFVCFFPG